MNRFYIFLFVFLTRFAVSQIAPGDDVLKVNKRDIHTSKKEDMHAELLVKKLIKHKTSDQEKFDAIFSWVTLNITYDYREFYSPTASIPASITRILKTKRTICLGYSNLMDTLCALAGITNVTVYGYAKDEFFDVNDSLYGHNHAWNAVKLDDLWYVYDATWSMGETAHKLTPMGKWLTKWFENHPEKMKRKKIRNKFKYKMKNRCGTPPDGPEYYYKQRYFNYVLRKRLARLPIKTHRVFLKGINKDYYLSEPSLFAITHIPDSPIWNLGSYAPFRKLETDSAYYYFTDSVMKTQTRQGMECPECDAYVALSKKEQLKDLNVRSYNFNKHNRFISVHCEKMLGKINLFQGLRENDSLSKIQFIDSARVCFMNTRAALQECKKNVSVATMLHKTKNKRKMALLLSENKAHMQFVSQKVKATLTYTRYYNRMASQGEAYAHVYLKKAKQISRFKVDIKTDKLSPYPEKTLAAIKDDLSKKEMQLDSLTSKINLQKQAFDSLLVNASLNIWQQVKQHDSVITPFIACINLRRNRKDNYKKVIVDIRNKIPPFEKRYANELNTIIYQPSEEAYTLFKSITALIQSKTKLQRECLKYNRELLRAKELGHMALLDYREQIVKDSEFDFCWIANNYPKLLTMKYGLNYLRRKQTNALYVINLENIVERHRHHDVNTDLQYGFREANKSLSFEFSTVKRTIKDLDAYRKSIVKPRRKR